MEQTVGYYRIEGEIGKGGMGTVYRAHDRALDRSVALKFLHNPDDGALKPEDLKRFKREARVTARLRHPNIVAILGAGAHEGRPYIVMDLVEGSSLRETILKKSAYGTREAARIAFKLAEALHYAHEQGVLHRDVKPENVLMTAQGEPVLTDFGVGKAMGRDTSITVTGEITGTPIYMPPEQATARTDLIGPRSDVFALGGTLYEMLTGVPPVRGKKVMEILEQVLNRPPDPPSSLRAGIDPELEAICLRCLQKELDQRYPDAGALADDLRDYLRARGGLGKLPVKPEPARGGLALGLFLGLILGAIVWAGISAIMVRSKVGQVKERVRQASLYLEQTGGRHLEAGDVEAALADFEKAIELTADLAGAHLGRGRALRRADRPQEALDALSEAIRLQPGLGDAYAERARILVALGKLAQAGPDLEQLETMAYPGLPALRKELFPKR